MSLEQVRVVCCCVLLCATNKELDVCFAAGLNRLHAPLVSVVCTGCGVSLRFRTHPLLRFFSFCLLFEQ